MTQTANPGPEQPPEREELVLFLERDQLTADTTIPVERAHLSDRTRALLWALRIFSILLSAMVIYTFAAQLH